MDRITCLRAEWSQAAVATITKVFILPLCILILIVVAPILVTLLLAGVMGSFFGSVFHFVRPLSITAKRVRMSDGRHVAWSEQGVPRDEARHTIIMLHGGPDCRITGIPGVSHSLLERYGVRVVTYDRPGYGQSDYSPWTLRTAAEDIESLATALHLPHKFWVLGYSGGGPFAWAAAKWIPHRLAGVALWAPDGNPWWPWIPSRYKKQLWKKMPCPARLRFLGFKALMYVMPPSVLGWLCPPRVIRCLLPLVTHPGVARMSLNYLGARDKAKLGEVGVKAMLGEMLRESLRQGNVRAYYEDLLVPCKEWGFDMVELLTFEAPIHLWQGTDDLDVPHELNRLVTSLLPHARFHSLPGEGHYSSFVANDEFHDRFLKTLFGIPLGPLNKN